MNFKELSLSDRKRALKAKDKLARETSARMLVANLYQRWKADPKVTIGIMCARGQEGDLRKHPIYPPLSIKGVKGG